MTKFQFFCKPGSERKEFTYLDMSSDTLSDEKAQLLQLDFEVEDDVIYASTAEEAVEKFRSNYLYALEEYNNAHPSSAFISLVIESYKEVRRRFAVR
ncbi:hypothetical protein [Vibrio aestuarianus]|uniref:hypothetical protein n=1 Tax=Vibrio aestuarianus TaxID=28171 RepID=UPI00237C59BC|nr:hypothetical protein [Vibrio aestuarianus]MDE1208876.1 hypothetical protein [Vibrio aestuarianus]